MKISPQIDTLWELQAQDKRKTGSYTRNFVDALYLQVPNPQLLKHGFFITVPLEHCRFSLGNFFY